jgi:hypothetical protein
MNWVIRIAVVGLVAFVGWIYQEVTSADRDDQGNISEAGEVNAFEIMVGDCLAQLEEESFTTTTAIPCTEPHAGEMFASTNLPQTIIFESQEYTSFILDFCDTNLFAYAGINANLDEFTYSYLGPTLEGFNKGDRDIDCVAQRADGMLTTGSIKNIGR